MRLDSDVCCRLTRLRGKLRSAIESLAVSKFARGVIRAITIGDGSGLSSETKALLRATGTSHLMAISGLHVGLLAGLGLLAIGGLWSRLPILCRRVPARVAGAVAGLSLAVPYSLLAGMGLPTQRALIMLSVFAGAMWLRRGQAILNALALAAILVLAWHPPSVLSAGFWLSFVAVAAILAAIQLGRDRPVWFRAVLVQLSISLALWPVLTMFGMPASATAPLFNLLLVPLFGFVVVPLSLLVVLFLPLWPDVAHWLAWPLGALLDGMHQSLASAVELCLPELVSVMPGMPPLVLLVTAVCLLLMPRGVPLRWLAIPVLGIVCLPPAPRLAPGEFELHLLDVGQGLGSVIETRRHTLVFDTGPEYPSGFSTAAAVIHPFLRKLGSRRIDRLILSHGDKDHAGGVEYLRSKLEVVRMQSGEPGRIGTGVTQCVAGERWQWDGVDFEFLHPPAQSRMSGNDASCVLRISNTAGSV
jgi:competence protein ComEC